MIIRICDMDLDVLFVEKQAELSVTRQTDRLATID